MPDTAHSTAALDQAKVEAFVGKCLGDFSGTMSTLLAALGDRLGLFRNLAKGGPATSAELADRAGVQERYAREWLRGMTAAGYLELDRESGRFGLPPEHVPALAQEAGPFFMCGAYSMIDGILAPFDTLVRSFREGGGVTQDQYGPSTWEGLQRFTATWFENALLGQWMPQVPQVHEKLTRGAVAADVGCGAGRASIAYAKAYPNSTFVGFDNFEGQIERARRNAEEAGVSDRVRFELLDVAAGLPERYDLVTTFDVIHDAVNPGGLLRAVREGTKDDGSYLMLEINCQDDPDDNEGPFATVFYGFSVFYCMTTSLAHGGEGLGACGMPEAMVRKLCGEAGFSGVRRLPIEDPFSIIYEMIP